MRCEFSYCVYNSDFFCILETTQINTYGMCEECIIVSIPEADLKLMKELQLKEMDERYMDDF